MDRLGFIILSILQKSEAIDRLSGMTVKEIVSSGDLGWKENTIFKKLKGFEQSGYVGRGLKDGRADTYFIKSKGCRRLEEERRSYL